MGCCMSLTKPKNKSLRRMTLSKQSFIKINYGKLTDSYKIVKKIGDGTFGQVLKVIHKDSNNIRAVKRIQITNSLNIAKLMEEVDLLIKIDHPNIIRIFEVIQEPRTVNIVMEICTGGELFDRIQSNKKFSETQAATYMHDIVSAVKYCHMNNIVHRDLKPENILFETMKSDARLKLIDFGASKFFKENEKIKGFAGSIYYVAPEVISNNYDSKCDVWSLGVILFIMLCGYPPFKGSDDTKTLKLIQDSEPHTESDSWKKVSTPCKDLILKMLQKDPSRRPDIDTVLKDDWFKLLNTQNLPIKSLKSTLSNLKEYSVI